jgi:hypothetical protein
MRGSAAGDEGVSAVKSSFSRNVGASSLITRALTLIMRDFAGKGECVALVR